MDREYYQGLSEAYQQVQQVQLNERGQQLRWLRNLLRGKGKNIDTPRPRPDVDVPRSRPGADDVIDVEVRDITGRELPPAAGTRPEPIPQTRPDAGAPRNTGQQGVATPRNINPIVGGAALTGLAGAGIYSGIQNNPHNNPPGATTPPPEGTTPPPAAAPPGTSSQNPGGTSSAPPTAAPSATTPTAGTGTRRRGLADALKDTQNAITAERKRKEGANYSGPSTVKKPGRYQSNIGTDFSDVAEGLMDELMETPKGELNLSPEAKVVKRNLRDGDDATPAATARRQFRSAALRGVKKPKPIKKPRQETRMPGEQLKDMQEGLPEPKVNYLKDMDPYDPRRSPRDHAPGSPLPPPSMRPGLPPMKLAKSKVKKPKNVKKA